MKTTKDCCSWVKNATEEDQWKTKNRSFVWNRLQYFSSFLIAKYICYFHYFWCDSRWWRRQYLSILLFERRCLSFRLSASVRLQTFPVIRFRWTDISNSRIQARRAWFLVSNKLEKSRWSKDLTYITDYSTTREQFKLEKIIWI